MKITIELNEANIIDYAEKEIARLLVADYTSESRDTKKGIIKGVEAAVKELVYSRRDELIERCVSRAAESISRKALPKLIEALNENKRSEMEGK